MDTLVDSATPISKEQAQDPALSTFAPVTRKKYELDKQLESKLEEVKEKTQELKKTITKKRKREADEDEKEAKRIRLTSAKSMAAMQREAYKTMEEIEREKLYDEIMRMNPKARITRKTSLPVLQYAKAQERKKQFRGIYLTICKSALMGVVQFTESSVPRILSWFGLSVSLKGFTKEVELNMPMYTRYIEDILNDMPQLPELGPMEAICAFLVVQAVKVGIRNGSGFNAQGEEVKTESS